MQNKILKLFANDIVRSVCSEVTKQKTVMFAVIVDGTRDNKRSDVHVNQLFDDAIVHVSKYDLEELKLPRQRRPPTRFAGPAAAYQVPDVREYFKNE